MRLNIKEQRPSLRYIRHFYIKIIALKLKLTKNPGQNKER